MGPTGFALTNSTCTRQPSPTPIRPKSLPCSRTSVSTRCSAAGLRRRLMKPGPATSTETMSGLSAIRDAMMSATSRGGLPAALAMRSATLVAQSPCSASRGRSGAGSGGSGRESSPSTAARSSACVTRSAMRDFTGRWLLRVRLDSQRPSGVGCSRRIGHVAAPKDSATTCAVRHDALRTARRGR